MMYSMQQIEQRQISKCHKFVQYNNVCIAIGQLTEEILFWKFDRKVLMDSIIQVLHLFPSLYDTLLYSNCIMKYFE